MAASARAGLTGGMRAGVVPLRPPASPLPPARRPVLAAATGRHAGTGDEDPFAARAAVTPGSRSRAESPAGSVFLP